MIKLRLKYFNIQLKAINDKHSITNLYYRFSVMMHQSPYTFGHQQQTFGAKKQKPSPPPRYHDLVEKSEMGIVISPNNPRELAPEMTRDVEVKMEFQPRSATMKLMAIIFAIIIISTFAGTLFAIIRLNQIEIMMNLKLKEMKTIIQLKQELAEDQNHRESIEEDGFSLLDTRLRLIDLKLQDLIDSHEEMIKEDYPTSRDYSSYDVDEEGDYTYDERSADTKENVEKAEYVEYLGFEGAEDDSEINGEDKTVVNLDTESNDDNSAIPEEDKIMRAQDLVTGDDGIVSVDTDEDKTKRNLDQDKAVSPETKNTTFTNDEGVQFDYNGEEHVTSDLE